MITGRISAVKREKLERRDDTRLASAWVEQPTTRSTPTGLAWLKPRAHGPRGPIERGVPMLAMIDSAESPALSALEAHAEGGERTYVLAPGGWGKGPIEARLKAFPRMLIRTLREVPVSALHTPSTAMMWFGGTAAGPTPWQLHLDDVQGESLRLLFLRLFWHEAVEEAWTGDRQFTFRPPGDRPFDVPIQGQESPLRLVPNDTRLDTTSDHSLVRLGSGPLPRTTPKHLWWPPSGEHHAKLVSLARKGAHIQWDDRDLPDLAVGAVGGVVLLPGRTARLRLQLTTAQAADAAKILEQAGSWAFRDDVRLGDCANAKQVWLPDAARAQSTEPEEVIPLPDVQAPSLRQVAASSPSAFPEAHPLTLSARYQWSVALPHAPVDAQEDALMARWRDVDGDWTRRVEAIRAAVVGASADRTRISAAFTRLVGAVLGFERTQEQLAGEIDALTGETPSLAGPDGAVNLFARLIKLEERTRTHGRELHDAERTARESDEREAQESAWRARVAASHRDLPAQKAALADAETRGRDLQRDMVQVGEATAAAEGSASKDALAQQKKVSDEQAKLKRTVAALRHEIAALEQSAAEPFVFAPPPHKTNFKSQSGNRFVPPTTPDKATLAVPEDALPEVGRLLQHRGKRYLVIDDWTALDSGERSAERLGARLVAGETP